MFFRSKKQNDQRRARQPIDRSSMPSSPVFSYHAHTARTVDSGKRSLHFPWQDKDSAPSPRKQPRRVPKRLVTVAVAVVVLVAAVGNLMLSRDPDVIALADTDNRQVFLRSEDDYTQAAQAMLASSWANSNKLTIDTKRLADNMQKQFPELESVTVTMPFFGRRPEFYIQPARPALLLRTKDGGTFIVDTAGRALMNVSQAPKAETLGLVLVEDQSGLQTALGRGALPSTNINFITEVIGQLKAKKLAITSMVLPQSTSELDVKVGSLPYAVKFNLRGDARAEVGAYLAVKQYLERQGKTPSAYIDVRVDNKAFYR